jgi:hypothetical protein
MYFVGNKSFKNLSDAMGCCSIGSEDDVVTNEDGVVLMRHHKIPIEDVFGLAVAKRVFKLQRDVGWLE